MRTRIKVCGLTRTEDIHALVDAGVDAVGLVFYPKSSRAVTPKQAASLRQQLPAFVDVVALFVNADPDYVRAVIAQVQPDLLQFHGDETPEYCKSLGHRYIRAFRVGGPGLEGSDSVLQTCLSYPDASAWLFDSYSPSYGGSGLTFDTALLSGVQEHPLAKPIVLAGGLTPQNVSASLQQVHPYAVDVSSGVEDSPGIKSQVKVFNFVHAVQRADYIVNQ